MTGVIEPLGASDLDRRLDTAAAHATLNVPVAHPDDLVDATLAAMRGREFDSAGVIAVCVDGMLVGLATVERLLAAGPQAAIRNVMDPDPPVVAPGVDQEHAAGRPCTTATRGSRSSTPTAGCVGWCRRINCSACCWRSTTRNLARLGGYLRSTGSARAASTESVRRRLWHRVGTQTEAVVIRGLSVGVPIRQVVAREVLTGLLVGLLLGATMLVVVAVVWADVAVAVAVGVAVLAASAIATLVAMALPWLLRRFGRDPAFGSGPLATVVQDLLSILIYFIAVAALLS